MEWYPQKNLELYELLNELLKNNHPIQEVHGIIVPHAGYSYSGKIAGKTFSYLRGANHKKAVILASSHYIRMRGLAKHNKPYWTTPIKKTKISEEGIKAREEDLSKEHAIGNQVPFLQKIGFQEIFPLVVGSITLQEAKKIAEILDNGKNIFVISADLSHFSDYETATEKDKKTIEIIQNLDFNRIGQLDSCGIFPILVAMNLCQINGWKPKLVEYKNSGDITGEKKSVVGYAGIVF